MGSETHSLELVVHGEFSSSCTIVHERAGFLDALASLDSKLSVSQKFMFSASASTGLSELFNSVPCASRKQLSEGHINSWRIDVAKLILKLNLFCRIKCIIPGWGAGDRLVYGLLSPAAAGPAVILGAPR